MPGKNEVERKPGELVIGQTVDGERQHFPRGLLAESCVPVGA